MDFLMFYFVEIMKKMRTIIIIDRNCAINWNFNFFNYTNLINYQGRFIKFIIHLHNYFIFKSFILLINTKKYYHFTNLEINYLC